MSIIGDGYLNVLPLVDPGFEADLEAQLEGPLASLGATLSATLSESMNAAFAGVGASAGGFGSAVEAAAAEAQTAVENMAAAVTVDLGAVADAFDTAAGSAAGFAAVFGAEAGAGGGAAAGFEADAAAADAFAGTLGGLDVEMLALGPAAEEASSSLVPLGVALEAAGGAAGGAGAEITLFGAQADGGSAALVPFVAELDATSVAEDAVSASAAGMAGAVGLALIAVEAIGGAAYEVVKQFENFGSGVIKIQQATGASAEDASKLNAVFQEFGVSADAGSKSLLRLTQNIQTHRAALEQLGVAEATTNNGQLDSIGTLLNVADAYSKASDQATRTAIVVEAFGGARFATTFLPLLSQGQQLEVMFNTLAAQRGEIFSPSDAEAAQQLGLSMHQLSADADALGVDVGKKAVPAIDQMIEGVDRLVKDANTLAKTPLIGGLFTASISPAADALALLGAGSNNAAKAAAEEQQTTSALTSELEGYGLSATDAATAAKSLASAHSNLADANDALDATVKSLQADLFNVFSAQQAVTGAEDSLSAANQRIIQDQQDINNLGATSVETLQAQQQAVDTLASSQANLASAAVRVTEAQTALNDALHPTALTVQKASADVQQAQAELAKANQDILDEQTKIKDLSASSLNDPQIADAQVTLQGYLASRAEATARLGDAQQKLNDLNPASVDGAQNVAKAQADLASAYAAQQSAQDQVAADKTKIDQDQATRLDSLKTKQDDLNQAIKEKGTAELSIAEDEAKYIADQQTLAAAIDDAGGGAQVLASQLQNVFAQLGSAGPGVQQLLTLLAAYGVNTSAVNAPRQLAGEPGAGYLNPQAQGPAAGGPLGASNASPTYGTGPINVTVTPPAGANPTQTGTTVGGAISRRVGRTP